MNPDKNIKKVLLWALSEPEYARVDYFKAKQAESIYSEKVYALKLKEALEYYISKINYREEKLNEIGNQVYDYKLSLFNETGGELYGHLGFGELESLANSLSQLIDSWYPQKMDLDPQVNKAKPIHWLKGEQSLRQFLESIKSAGLIEHRDTDDIIMEHISVDGQMPTKELKHIKWLIESKYLAYLMHRLAEEFIINIKDRKHELTASHFISSYDKPLNTNSLASQLSTLMKHGKPTDDKIKSIEKIIQQVKS